MKKYVTTGTGEEVTMGACLMAETGSGYLILPVEPETIPYLLREGLIKEASDKGKKEEGTHLDIYFYVEHLAKRIHWNPENLAKYLDNLATVNETAVFQILLKEIAIVFDEKYKNHIENSSEIWSINLVNGEIIRVDKNRIKNYRNFAAFRTLEDAIGAKRILKDYMKPLFEKGGK